MCNVLLSQLLYILFQFPRCKHGICAEKKMLRHSAGSVLYEEMQRILHTNVNISFWQFLHLCSSSGSSFRRLQHMVFRYYYYYLWNSFFPTPFLRIFISLYFLLLLSLLPPQQIVRMHVPTHTYTFGPGSFQVNRLQSLRRQKRHTTCYISNIFVAKIKLNETKNEWTKERKKGCRRSNKKKQNVNNSTSENFMKKIWILLQWLNIYNWMRRSLLHHLVLAENKTKQSHLKALFGSHKRILQQCRISCKIWVPMIFPIF